MPIMTYEEWQQAIVTKVWGKYGLQVFKLYHTKRSTMGSVDIYAKYTSELLSLRRSVASNRPSHTLPTGEIILLPMRRDYLLYLDNVGGDDSEGMRARL